MIKTKMIAKISFFILAFTITKVQGQFNVGDTLNCGIIFFSKLDSLKHHLLICALRDLSKKTQWSTGSYKTTSAIEDILFDKKNAEKIVERHGKSPFYAARMAQRFSPQGPGCDTGWYLPSKAELKLIYDTLARNPKFKFAREGYWSSVEKDSTNNLLKKPIRKAWIVDFFNGREILNDKANKYRVRPVKEIFIQK